MILHVDMDAFYASVEEREQPELRGRPVIVGGDPKSRGVVCAANYIARKFGVHSAMPSAQAIRRCPQAVFLPPRISFYATIAQQIRNVFYRFTPLVEPLSLDEAFLDVQGCEQLFGDAEKIGRTIQQTIQSELHLAASVGVAPNKFLAKLASDFDKPNGFVVIPEDGIMSFLDPLPIRRLWGVGKAALQKMERLQVKTVGQLRHISVEILRSQFGQSGEQLWRLAHGIDDRHVVPDSQAKSVSRETTFPVDIDDTDILRSWLMLLTEQVARRLRRQELVGKTVQLKLRYSNFQTITRSYSFPQATNATQEIWQELDALLTEHFATILSKKERSTTKTAQLPPHNAIRLIGVGMTRLSTTEQQVVQKTLFDEETSQQNNRLDEVTDAIANKFGDSAVRRAIGMNRSQRESETGHSEKE